MPWMRAYSSSVRPCFAMISLVMAVSVIVVKKDAQPFEKNARTQSNPDP